MAAFKNKDNGTWYVQFRYTDWRGERQQKPKRGFSTKKEAQAWEREFLMEKQSDVNMTFESFVALYGKDIKPKLKLNTWLTKDNIIQKKILPYFKKRKLSEISAKDIIDWQNEMRGLTDCHGKPLSTTYLKTVHNQLSAIFNHAIRYYGLQVNPAQRAGNMGTEERREMDRGCKETGVKRIRIHDLRHPYVKPTTKKYDVRKGAKCLILQAVLLLLCLCVRQVKMLAKGPQKG